MIPKYRAGRLVCGEVKWYQFWKFWGYIKYLERSVKSHEDSYTALINYFNRIHDEKEDLKKQLRKLNETT